MTILLFANQAQTTLALPVVPSDTTIYVANGTGQYFPNPQVGEGFKLTLVNATNSLVDEIVLVTARVGDVMTVVRGQEGTIPQAWKFGDFAVNLDTAGSSDAFVQFDQIKNGSINAYFANMRATTGQVDSVPVNPTDLVNKEYADYLVQGMTPKAESQCATTTVAQGGGHIAVNCKN